MSFHFVCASTHCVTRCALLEETLETAVEPRHRAREYALQALQCYIPRGITYCLFYMRRRKITPPPPPSLSQNRKAICLLSKTFVLFKEFLGHLVPARGQRLQQRVLPYPRPSASRPVGSRWSRHAEVRNMFGELSDAVD